MKKIPTPKAPQNTKEWNDRRNKDLKQKKEYKRLMAENQRFRREQFEKARDEKCRPYREKLMEHIGKIQEKWAEKRRLRVLRKNNPA